MANYGNNTMRLQDDREAMRTYPNNYVGSDDINGVFQTLKEILSNAVDEANAGFGKEVNININKNNEISIEDFGRGLPMAYNSVEKLYNWEIALCRLHGGGKFKDDRSSYNSSSGQHGIGAAATQLSSEFMDVISKRDGYEYIMHFEKGLPVGKLEKTKLSDKTTGTKITWKPDIEVFTEIEIPLEMITEWLRLQAIVNKGLKINFTDERHNVEEIFYYEKGIEEYAEQKNNLSEVIYFEVEGAGQDTPTRPIYEVKGELVFAVTENPETMYFHNTIPLEYGGSPNKAMETAFLEFFNHVDKFKDLTVEDITQNLLFISSTYTVIPPSFENQTKKAISNKFIQDFLTNQILIKLQEWKKTNPLDFETLLKRVKVNNESRKSAALHRELKKKKLTENISGIKTRIDNYVDCRSKDTGKRELYICEGLSALSSLKQARDADYQALLPIKGKILSTMKATPSRVLANKLLKDITNLIGVGINSKSTKVNMDNLNFNKIIMACFTGDTKVATLNGDFTFNELIGQDNVWVYAKDRDGNTVPTKAYNIQKIKDVDKLVKITLDNDEEIKTTLDHNFMLRNGSYKEAKDLVVGESLMPHYTQYDKKGYLQYYDQNEAKFKHVHRLVAETINKQDQVDAQTRLEKEIQADLVGPFNAKLDVHHADYNKLNNNPNNLMWLTSLEHFRDYNPDWTANGWNGSEAQKEMLKQKHKDGVYDHVYKDFQGYNGSEAQKEMLRQKHKDGVYDHCYVRFQGYNGSEAQKEMLKKLNASEHHIVAVERGKVTMSIRYLIEHDLEFNEETFNNFRHRTSVKYENITKYFDSYEEAFAEARKREYRDYTKASDPGVFQYNNNKKQRNQIAKVIYKLIQNNLPFNQESYNDTKGSRTVAYENITKYFEDYSTAYEYAENYNHKITKIEIIDLDQPEPVYCLTADTYHNFALSAGVFVKNCDADLDAYHIIALMLTFFYNFMPELLLEGKVYSLVTPLFEITYKDGTKAFAYTEEEREKLIKPGCKISRNKGLGEVNADVMAKCLHKDTQHLIQYTLEDGKLADEYMKLFMDTDVEPRKEYIIDNMNKYEVDIAEL